MDWQEAIVKSIMRRAFRINENGNMIYRYWDGHGVEILHGGFGIELEPMELEGYLDWEPCEAPSDRNAEWEREGR